MEKNSARQVVSYYYFYPLFFVAHGILRVVLPHYVEIWHVGAPLIRAAGLVITRNLSGDEIANVNFLYDDIVHALKIQ